MHNAAGAFQQIYALTGWICIICSNSACAQPLEVRKVVAALKEQGQPKDSQVW